MIPKRRIIYYFDYYFLIRDGSLIGFGDGVEDILINLWTFLSPSETSYYPLQHTSEQTIYTFHALSAVKVELSYR